MGYHTVEINPVNCFIGDISFCINLVFISCYDVHTSDHITQWGINKELKLQNSLIIIIVIIVIVIIIVVVMYADHNLGM